MIGWSISRPVTLRGLDYFGRNSFIQFTPADHDEIKWCPVLGKQPISITPELCEYRRRRLRLRSGIHKQEIIEHILALRMLGLTGVNFHASDWPPYSGRTLELAEALNNAYVERSRGERWYTIKHPVRWYYPQQRGGMSAYSALYPERDQKLELEITVNFPYLGKANASFVFPDPGLIWEIMKSRTPGLPPSLYYPSRFTPKCIWPHHDKMAWIQEGDKGCILEEYVKHRAQDILGTLAILCPDGMFAGRFVSQCSGHEADWNVIQQALILSR